MGHICQVVKALFLKNQRLWVKTPVRSIFYAFEQNTSSAFAIVNSAIQLVQAMLVAAMTGLFSLWP